MSIDIQKRYERVLREVESCARASGRDPACVKIIVVTKGQSFDRIKPLLDIGVRDFGESRWQEAREKWENVSDVRLHFIGPLQSNKLQEIAQMFHGVHSLFKIKHLAILSTMTGTPKELFAQVNIGEEPQKSGIDGAEISSFFQQARDLEVPLVGLMGIPPYGCDPQPYFQRLAELAGEHGLREVSMGMSEDWREAIRCGATRIRLGRVFFGDDK